VTLFIPIWFLLFSLCVAVISSEAFKVCAALELERRKLRSLRTNQALFEMVFFRQNAFSLAYKRRGFV
jgi:hypothetical protein